MEVQRHLFLASALDNQVVSFRPRLLCHCGKSSQYPLDRRMGVPPSLPGRFGTGTDLFPLSGIEPRFRGRPAHGSVTTQSTLSRFVLLFLSLRILTYVATQVRKSA